MSSDKHSNKPHFNTFQPSLPRTSYISVNPSVPLSPSLRSPDVALAAWQNVESAQLINTVPQPLGTAPRQGMGTELEDVETRLEEYPMTRAFLHLVDVLTDSTVPNSLGAGTRSEIDHD